MKLDAHYIHFLTLFLVILQNEAASGNLYEIQQQSDALWEVLEIIIQSCYNKYFGNFILIGNWTAEESSILNIIFYNLIPVTLVAVKENSIFEKHQCKRGFFHVSETILNIKCKLINNVTIVVSSNITLNSILENLKVSVWWNNKSYFFIVNPDSHNGCRSAREFLKIIWNFKILSALYFCRNIKGHVTIYNFNPYTDRGSNIWKVVDDIDKKSEHWTLLQFYDKKLFTHYKSVMTCDTFGFDKTRNLDQYMIRIGRKRGVVPVKLSKYPKPGFADYGYEDYKVFDIVLERLNARGTLKSFKTFGFLSKNGPTGFLKDLHLGTIDFVMSQMFIRDYWDQMTYPVDTSGVCIVARMYPISFTKIFMSIFTKQVWLCILVTSLISIITIKYSLNQSLTTSLLEFLRMLFATPSFRSPTTGRGKFLFSNILLLIFIIDIYIQSHLNAIQTVPGYIRSIDSPYDLNHSNLSFHGEPHHRGLIYPLELRERFQEIHDIHVCLKRLSNNDKLVCLVYTDIIRAFNYLNDKIYKAKNNLFDRPIAYTFVQDWPLASRVNSLLIYIYEAGIFSYYQGDWPRYEQKTEDSAIDMKQMRFSFLIFYSGCILSISMFLAELIMYNANCAYYSTLFFYNRKMCKFFKISDWFFWYQQKN